MKVITIEVNSVLFHTYTVLGNINAKPYSLLLWCLANNKNNRQ